MEKVIQMLADMSAKGAQEQKDERVAFARYATWCKTEAATLKKEMKVGSEEIERLASEIGKLGSDVETLGEAIAKLKDGEAEFGADATAKRAQREKDHAAFVAEDKDISESVDALEQALVALSRQGGDQPGAAASLLQVSALQRLPEKAQTLMAAFLGMESGGNSDGSSADPLDDYEAPEANAYESHSGNIVELVKKFRDDFREKLSTCQKEEVNAKHAAEMILLDLTDSIENANRDASEKAALRERKKSELAKREKQLGGVKAVQAESDKLLKETKTQCREKSLSFEEKQRLRGDELEAIAKASEILKSPDVAGNARKHFSLVHVAPASVAASLLQAGVAEHLVARRRGATDREGEESVRDFLTAEGKRLHSQRIVLLAEQVAAAPFGKVKAMISKMIERLLAEGNQDATHEGFCTEELGKSEVTRTKLTEQAEGLTAAIADGKATTMRLGEETAKLAREVQELTESMTEVTRMRAEEAAKSKETIADAQAASTAVSKAVAVLKDFYSKALVATALLQGGAAGPRIKMGTTEWQTLGQPGSNFDKGHQEGMGTYGAVERGQSERSSGVLGLLEVLAGDFSALEADTQTAEDRAVRSHSRYMVEARTSVTTMQRKTEMNNADKAEADAKVREAMAELTSTQDQVLAADRYRQKLDSQCMDQGMTWDERVAAREAEIDSLKEALQVLDSPDVA